jgi:hypothetical protein
MERYKSDLDDRIAAALGNNGAAVVDNKLIEDLEWSIQQAERTIEQERTVSLDPTTSLREAELAAQRQVVAELKRDRLKTALPRIAAKIAFVERSQAIAKFSGDADVVEQWVAVVSKKVTATYTELAERMVAALREATAANAEADKINHSAPDSVNRRVGKVDLAWARNLILPDAQHPSRNLWPPRSSISLYTATEEMDAEDAQAMAKARQRALADAQRAEQERPQRIASRYEQMTRQQEERWNREERERVAQLQRR